MKWLNLGNWEVVVWVNLFYGIRKFIVIIYGVFCFFVYILVVYFVLREIKKVWDYIYFFEELR